MAKRVVQDIWQGDSIELCERLKPNVNCVITDPPFGIDNQSNRAVTPHGKAHARKIANDENPEQAIKVFQSVMDALLPKTTAEADLYIFTAWNVLREWIDVADSLKRHGFRLCANLIWEKNAPGQGNTGAWHTGHEYILYLKKGNRTMTDRRRNAVLHVPPVPPGKLIHPHEKPIELIQILIRHSTSRGDFIVDPFAGSGATIRAAKVLSRSALGMELDSFNHTSALRSLKTMGEPMFDAEEEFEQAS